MEVAQACFEKQQDAQPSKSGGTSKETSVPLDKFKRRLVRAVARLLQQKKPENEMWIELKKEIGCDCRMLWKHMRALTLKKLKRLLPANDLLANIKTIARFTATDWLLFDLILVHEKINVISIGEMESGDSTAGDGGKEEPSCLHELFELVQQHRVESLSGDDLLEAWIRVTLQYNSRGRQSSPMLLQLRWYQLKELSRARFYNFWCMYRGNKKMVDRAMKDKPTALQAKIAQEYKRIITTPYPEWETLIEERRVILSEEFTLNREVKRKVEKARDEIEDELQLIEPQVETIELEVDSDVESDSIGNKISNTENKSQFQKYETEHVPHCDASNVDDYNVETSIISNIKDERNEIILEGTIELDDDLEEENNSHAKDNSIESTSNIAATNEPDDNELELIVSSQIESTNKSLEESKENECKDITSTSISDISMTVISNNVDNTLPKIVNVACSAHELSSEYNSDDIIQLKAEKCMQVAIPQAMSHSNSQSIKKEPEQVHSDSDEEINKILLEKANNLASIEITHIKSEYGPTNLLSVSEGNIKLTNQLCDSNEPILCECNEVINKKFSHYASLKLPQTNADPTVRCHQITNTLSKNTDVNEAIKAEKSNEYEADEIDKEEKTVKKEKVEEGFDDLNFDDDQIEFVDDGIEFVEEVKIEKIDPKTENSSSSDSDDEDLQKFDEFPKIDLKLLMNPTVYTKKLDEMEVFKLTEYTYVNDKSVIESAILESKPVDILALKDEDINKFRENTLRGYETDGTQSESDIVQTEYVENRIKSTSWLLQKPKKRSYNPIQLCKNPDFNTRLKRLTAGFLSSTRNRALLKECQPLTIDLHKAFEKKLIAGTLYLKGGDFKSAKSTVVDDITKDQVSVVPSALPGLINNNSTAAPVEKPDSQQDNLPLSSTDSKFLPNERRKIINLPDIDQVRRVNQSLLTAEVSPIRIDNNTMSCKNQDLITSVVEQSIFVQPIVLASTAQLKKEPSELDVKEKNFQSYLKAQHKMNTAKELMASKINDQIVDISHQISEVETNEFANANVDKNVLNQYEKFENPKKGRPKKEKSITKIKIPTPKPRYLPLYRDQITWAPKYADNYVEDSLLTLDTLNKIMCLLNGDQQLKKKSKGAQNKSNETNSTNSQINNSEQTTELSCASGQKKNYTQRGRPKKTVQRKQVVPLPKKYAGVYCCWARERIIVLTNGRTKRLAMSEHGCLKFKCTCCCRYDLVKLSTSIRHESTKKSSKKSQYPIELSDDEEINNHDQNVNKFSTTALQDKTVVCTTIPEIVLQDSNESTDLDNKNPDTPNTSTAAPDKISIQILVPELTPIATTSVCNDVCEIKSITAESVQPIDSVQTNKPRCKTYVHAAEGHTYNKRDDSVNSLGISTTSIATQCKIDNYSQKPMPSILPICKTAASNSNVVPAITQSKEIERTLYLNSSQLLNQPTKGPIYLGTKKILLCSLNKPTATPSDLASLLPVLPYGTQLVLLPNGELELSIDQGVQLDAEQLSTLPALMSSVHQQFQKSKIANTMVTNVPQQNVADTQEESCVRNQTDPVQHLDTEIETPHISSQQVNALPINKDQTKEAANLCCNLEKKQNTKDGVVDKETETAVECLNSDSENVSSRLAFTESKEKLEQAECQKSVEEHKSRNTDIQIEDHTTEPQTNIENTAENSQDIEMQSTETCANDERNQMDNNSNNINMTSRKTILSDLMEMSGISAEDTNLSSDTPNFCVPATPLPPNIIPITRVSGSSTSCNVPGSISITGLYSNLLSFEPNTPVNRLLHYIGQTRPELNAVTSFAELKYVYENKGQFYKLDMDSGSIVPINVCIKKTIKSQISKKPQAFIDLTIDAANDDDEVSCAEFQDIPQDKQQDSNYRVKSFELSKAVHPTILQNKSGRMVKRDEIVYPKTMIRINNKQKRKKVMKVGNKFIVLDSKENIEIKEVKSIKLPSPSQLDSSYDSSDEEPLAKKCKRKREAEEKVLEKPTSVLATTEPRNSDSEKITDSRELPKMRGDFPDISGSAQDMSSHIPDMHGDMSDLEMNIMDIEGVNPELHPVVFEEDSESDEDMCILGM